MELLLAAYWFLKRSVKEYTELVITFSAKEKCLLHNLIFFILSYFFFVVVVSLAVYINF